MLGVEPRDELVAAHSVAELSSIVFRSEEHGALESDDASLLAGALSFAEQPVRDIARPWAEVPRVRLGATGNQARRLVRDTGRSRILVQARGPNGRLQGYVHAKDLLPLTPEELSKPLSQCRSCVRPLRCRATVLSSTSFASCAAPNNNSRWCMDGDQPDRRGVHRRGGTRPRAELRPPERRLRDERRK